MEDQGKSKTTAQEPSSSTSSKPASEETTSDAISTLTISDETAPKVSGFKKLFTAQRRGNSESIFPSTIKMSLLKPKFLMPALRRGNVASSVPQDPTPQNNEEVELSVMGSDSSARRESLEEELSGDTLSPLLSESRSVNVPRPGLRLGRTTVHTIENAPGSPGERSTFSEDSSVGWDTRGKWCENFTYMYIGGASVLIICLIAVIVITSIFRSNNAANTNGTTTVVISSFDLGSKNFSIYFE